jgi:hypothetical protein
MGTFTIIPDSFSISGGTFRDNTSAGVYGALTLATVLSNNIISGGPPPFPQAINSFAGAGVLTEDAILRLGFSLVGNIISLDGNPAISFAGLPSGFTIISALISIYTTNNGSDVTNHFRVTFDTSVESGDLNFINPRTFAYPGVLPSTLLFFLQGCGIHVNNLTVGQQTSRWFGNYKVTGTYIIVSTNWTLPLSSIKAGDKVTLTSVSPLAQGVTQVLIQHSGQTTEIAAQDFLEQTPTFITFYMPEFGNYNGPVTVTVVGNGVQFSGSVLIGNLTVAFVDASGIYVLTPLKPTDTVYDRTTPGATVDVAIQDPTIETAFLP